jgi:ankyrin repeat protein
MNDERDYLAEIEEMIAQKRKKAKRITIKPEPKPKISKKESTELGKKIYEELKNSNYDILSIREMLMLGADVNYRGVMEHSFLHASVILNDVNLLKLFIKHGGDVNAKAMGGISLVHLMVFVNPDSELLSVLIENGLDINIKDETGNTAMFWAVKLENTKMIELIKCFGGKL